MSTATNPAPTTLETETCTRCGGSGHYSSCASHGTRCFKCGGRKITLTARGAVAAAYLATLRSKRVEAVVVGDTVAVSAFLGSWLTVSAIDAAGGRIALRGGRACSREHDPGEADGGAERGDLRRCAGVPGYAHQGGDGAPGCGLRERHRRGGARPMACRACLREGTRPMTHPYPRIERDLRALAFHFTDGILPARSLPERLECLAAYARTVLEAEKAATGQPNAYELADRDYARAIERLRAAGVGPSEGEYTYSPCMGPEER